METNEKSENVEELRLKLRTELEGLHSVILEMVGHLDGVGRMSESWFLILKSLLVGLFLGVGGNLVVSHWSDVFQGLMTKNFDDLFWGSTIVFTVGLIALLLVSYSYYKSMQEYEQLWTSVQESSKLCHKAAKKLEEKLSKSSLV